MPSLDSAPLIISHIDNVPLTLSKSPSKRKTMTNGHGSNLASNIKTNGAIASVPVSTSRRKVIGGDGKGVTASPVRNIRAKSTVFSDGLDGNDNVSPFDAVLAAAGIESEPNHTFKAPITKTTRPISIYSSGQLSSSMYRWFSLIMSC